MDLSPLNLGMIAAYYYINYTTIGETLQVLASTTHYLTNTSPRLVSEKIGGVRNMNTIIGPCLSRLLVYR